MFVKATTIPLLIVVAVSELLTRPALVAQANLAIMLNSNPQDLFGAMLVMESLSHTYMIISGNEDIPTFLVRTTLKCKFLDNRAKGLA